MPSDLSDSIRSMVEEKGFSQDLVLATIEDLLKAAYKRKYGTDENAIVQFSDDLSQVDIFSSKTVVEEENYYNEVTEIPLDEAQEIFDDCAVGDVINIPINISEFDRISVQSAKQRAHQNFRDFQKDALYSEFKAKEGQLIIGYYRRQVNGDVYVNLGNTEGVLPRRFQNPRETYSINEKIKCYVEKVEKADRGVRVILSRSSAELVRQLFEVEVPEIFQGTVVIDRIAREAGYRTKIAVSSKNPDIDPVGSCVGLKGVRIQTVMTELEGEKIDIVHYDDNPANFIANALLPAQVVDVVITDRLTKRAIAVVEDSQLSLAIGKTGLNVRLANKLCDWIIEVKTVAQYKEMDISQEVRNKAEAIFDGEAFEEAQAETAEEQKPSEVISGVDEDEMILRDLPLDKMLVKKLEFHDVYTVEEYVNLSDEDFEAFGDLSAEDIASINEVISQYVDIVEEEAEDEEVEYLCPNCGAVITPDMTECPNCKTGLAFESVDAE